MEYSFYNYILRNYPVSTFKFYNPSNFDTYISSYLRNTPYDGLAENEIVKFTKLIPFDQQNRVFSEPPRKRGKHTYSATENDPLNVTRIKLLEKHDDPLDRNFKQLKASASCIDTSQCTKYSSSDEEDVDKDDDVVQETIKPVEGIRRVTFRRDVDEDEDFDENNVETNETSNAAEINLQYLSPEEEETYISRLHQSQTRIANDVETEPYAEVEDVDVPVAETLPIPTPTVISEPIPSTSRESRSRMPPPPIPPPKPQKPQTKTLSPAMRAAKEFDRLLEARPVLESVEPRVRPLGSQRHRFSTEIRQRREETVGRSLSPQNFYFGDNQSSTTINDDDFSL